jgi:membrane-associated protein
MNVEQIIQTGGLLAIGLMLFAETGLLIGFILPGDTLLFSAGIFAAAGHFNIVALLATTIITSIVGNNVGYEIGKRSGHRIFKREDGILFRKEYLVKANEFYEKHGGKTIVMARFVPIIRTFAPIVAGMGSMEMRRFTTYNIAGGIVWAGGITMLGFFFGDRIPNVEKYIVPLFILANIVTWGPVLWHVLKDPKARKKIKNKLTRKQHP